ncbi:hAT family C-terminal dimerization region [Phytophthora infestans]|uniref:HAT family C-terminal dimerization region n=1 Tax=Phytophthora infestans TaxID=4787 RepID=A0A8S9TW10_PHYIN|nr:hAT family C-terminal dimerization region [Phytophthora infestans]
MSLRTGAIPASSGNPPVVIEQRDLTVRPGRKADAAWSHVDVDPQGGVWFKKCNQLLQTTGRSHVERIKHHLTKRCSAKRTTALITDTFRPRLKSDTTKQFQDRLAWWVYSTGMPFYRIGHISFLEALQLLHPDVKVPSPEQLATVFLDRAYSKSIKMLKVALDGKIVTLVTDGWTDINGLAVVNYVVVCGEYTFFLESVYTGTQAHDAEFLAADIERVIAKYDFLEVGAVVTDNTNANKATWETLQNKFPKTFFHGCVCHGLHLLVKDIVKKVKWMDTLQSGCKEMVTFFKKNHKAWAELSAQLEEKDLQVLAKPGDTRWGSLLKCFETVLAAEAILFSRVSARGFLKAKIKKQKKTRRGVHTLVTSAEFVPRLKKAIAILKPISKALKLFEKNVTPVSEVYQVFVDLPNELKATGLTAAEYKSVDALVSSRFEFIYGDAHGIAYLLDPRYAGIDMDSSLRSAVEDFVVQWHDEEKADAVIVELSAYHRHVRDLKVTQPRQWGLLCERKIPLFDFWCGLNNLPLLQDIALRLFRCAASSAASERNFSAHAFIHSKLRNRLAPDRVEKLVHIFFNAKNICDEDIERYSHLEDLLRVFVEEDEEEDTGTSNQSDDFVYC